MCSVQKYQTLRRNIKISSRCNITVFKILNNDFFCQNIHSEGGNPLKITNRKVNKFNW